MGHETVIIIGSSGVCGLATFWLIIKNRFQQIDTELAFLREHARYDSTCDKISDGMIQRLEIIEALSKESRDDIRSVLNKI